MVIRRLSLLLLAFVVTGSCSKNDPAPTPVITGFTPASGPVASAVTITGANFSTTPAANEVKFNGASAEVTTSSATSITVKVPPDATTGIISVTIHGQSAISQTAFTLNPLIGTWSNTGVTANNCVDITDNGVYPCASGCPTLTFSATTIVYSLSGSSVNFSYSLSGNRLDISNGVTVFSPTYVLSGDHLTLVYPPDECVLTETYTRL